MTMLFKKTSRKTMLKYAIALPIIVFGFQATNANAQTAATKYAQVGERLDTIVSYDPKTYKESMEIVQKSIYDGADEMPQFCSDKNRKTCGAQTLSDFLTKNIKYPKAAQARKAQETVLVELQVVSVIIGGSDYSAIDDATIKVVKSTDPDLAAEALRVAKTLKYWTTAKTDGKPVTVKMVLPIKFALD